jgi:NadR type nicotinamide-nucleotide adenylyltransferase
MSELGDTRLVTLTGSECTGKTTLALDLAESLGAPCVPEAARLYAESRTEPLRYEDVGPIARAHIAAAEAAIAQHPRLIILDTDLLSTVVYSRHYYGACPAWVEQAARERLADLYLLHHTDVPWLPDPSRDRGHMREHMHGLFRAALDEFGARVVDISGSWAERASKARRVITEMLDSGVSQR